MWNKIILSIGLLLLPVFSRGENLADLKPNNFQQAKAIIRKYLLHDLETIYSGCKISAVNQIDFASCDFTPDLKSVREQRLEFEHIFPMAHAKYHFQCWREPLCIDKLGHKFRGRRCCQQIDPRFRQLEAELYNLWPEIGIVNQARSDFKFGQFNSMEKQILGKYHKLPIYIDPRVRKIEPRDFAKGIVARANLYIALTYKIRLSKAQAHLFKSWNKQYPPNKMEIKWANKIANLTGRSNPFISQWQQNIAP